LIEKCPRCGKEFNATRSQKYCSSECRENSRKERHLRPPLTERKCKYCGVVFMPSSGKQKYCCKEHTFKGIYLENAEEKKEKSREYRLKNIDAIRLKDRERNAKRMDYKRASDAKNHDKTRFSGNRELVLERDGYKCVECGAVEKLAVHHKDHTGQTENRNDDPSNLITLCSSCHGKQHGKPINQEIHIIAVCGVCGKEFNTTTYLIEGGRGKYCSAECQKKRNSKTNTVTLNCEYCGKEFTVPLSRYKRGKVKYDSMECRRAAGYAWTNKQSTN